MHKCLKIMLSGEFTPKFLQSFISDSARKLKLEGTAQFVEDGQKVKVIVCGAKDDVDSFLDIVHKGSKSFSATQVEVEPFLKDKDYRGVFRVIA